MDPGHRRWQERKVEMDRNGNKLIKELATILLACAPNSLNVSQNYAVETKKLKTCN